ncbi:MAG TPA: hypothetical protein VKB03_08085 [Conexibacter sp.]|nr:hypothetical protein [Conexibacter sp.]
MRVVFSECRSDEARYLSPYQVLAYLEAGERPSDAFAAGFLPRTPELGRFYLSRSVRVDLSRYGDDARTRRVQRKCHGIDAELAPAAHFAFDDEWRALFRSYMAERRSAPPSVEAFASRLRAAGTTDVLVFVDRRAERRVGLATLYLEPEAALWGTSIYATAYLDRSIGRFMVAKVIETARRAGCRFAYLGNVYRREHLYKCRFPGTEFFNGWSWSDDHAELRFLLEHREVSGEEHLLDREAYAAWGSVLARSASDLRLHLTTGHRPHASCAD